MAQVCKCGNSTEDFMRFLINATGHWLLILDNADDASLEVSAFFPAGNRGTVIVTTRDPDRRSHATVGSKEIHNMKGDEAVTLLLKCAGLPNSNEDLRRQALPIIKTLGYLALAVVHAGASIRQKVCRLADYLGFYTRYRKKLFSRRPQGGGTDYRYTVYTTWQISVEAIRKDCKDATARSALAFLNMFGFFHSDNIAEDMFHHFGEPIGCNLVVAEEAELLPDPSLWRKEASGWDSLAFKEAMRLLSRYSLIQIHDTSGRISLHPLVHSWIRDSLDDRAHTVVWIITLSTLVKACQNLVLIGSELIIHLFHCMEAGQLESLLLGDADTEARMLLLFHVIEKVQQYRPESGMQGLVEDALELCHIELGGGSLLTLAFKRALAMEYNLCEAYEETVQLLAPICFHCDADHDKGIELIILVKAELAHAFIALNQEDGAREIVEHSLRYLRGHGNARPYDYQVALEATANVCSHLRDFGASIELRKEILDRAETPEGRCSALAGLAEDSAASGQMHTALELFQDIYRDVLDLDGPHHFHSASALASIGLTQCALGLTQPGSKTIIEALNILERGGYTDGLGDIFNLLRPYKDRLQRVSIQQNMNVVDCSPLFDGSLDHAMDEWRGVLKLLKEWRLLLRRRNFCPEINTFLPSYS
ncbi:MAG: hypothetical protein Q9222_004628 [Ikaeria aurantiellina]